MLCKFSLCLLLSLITASFSCLAHQSSSVHFHADAPPYVITTFLIASFSSWCSRDMVAVAAGLAVGPAALHFFTKQLAVSTDTMTMLRGSFVLRELVGHRFLQSMPEIKLVL